jgi:hypothetical protein
LGVPDFDEINHATATDKINIPPHVVEDLGKELLEVQTEPDLGKFLTRSQKLGLILPTTHLDIHAGTHLQYKVGACDMYCYGDDASADPVIVAKVKAEVARIQTEREITDNADLKVYVLSDGIRAGKLCRDEDQKSKYEEHWEERDDSKVRVALMTRDVVEGVFKLWVPFYKLQTINEYTVLTTDFLITDTMKTSFDATTDDGTSTATTTDGSWKKIYKVRTKFLNDDYNSMGMITFKDAQEFSLQQFEDECTCPQDAVPGRK